jgi:hypothetical protein
MKPQIDGAPNFVYALLQLPKRSVTAQTKYPLSTEIILFAEIRIYRNPIGPI